MSQGITLGPSGIIVPKEDRTSVHDTSTISSAGGETTTGLSRVSIGSDAPLQQTTMSANHTPPPLPVRKAAGFIVPPPLPPRMPVTPVLAQGGSGPASPTPAQSALSRVAGNASGADGSSTGARHDHRNETATSGSAQSRAHIQSDMTAPSSQPNVDYQGASGSSPARSPPKGPSTPARQSHKAPIMITPTKTATQALSSSTRSDTARSLAVPDVQSTIDATVGSVAEVLVGVAGGVANKAAEVLPVLKSGTSTVDPGTENTTSAYDPPSGSSPDYPAHPSQPPLPSHSLPLPPAIPSLLLTIICLTTYLTHSLWWTFCAGLACWFFWADAERRGRERAEGPEVGRERVRGPPVGDEDRAKEESVEWMNHALTALFPLISTDLLTPVLDLLEDALLTQVPAIIPSVRLTSLSLGREPIRIVSMRPMSDAEWFANLSSAPSAPGDPNAAQTLNPFNPFQPFHRNAKARSQPPRKDAAVRNKEVGDRQKRDEILRNVGGVRGQGVGATEKQAQRGESAGTSAHDDSFQHGQARTENTGVRGDREGTTGTDEEQKGDGDESGGSYLNLAIDFAYDGRKNKGDMTFHFLGYFGVGVRGVGQTEMPIWIELLKITGTAHIRILLTPSVPFMRTATVSLPEIPEFDLSAKPIKSLSLDFMGLPLVKPFMEKSVRIVADAFVRPRCYSLDIDRILLGQEASIRTATIGVLHIRINRAKGLKSSDTVGSSDPYCSLSYTKLSKPLFSTRIIVDSLNPRWAEDAFTDAIESGERVRLTVYDSDRFSADDSLGMVDRELSDMLEESTKRKGSQDLQTREDPLVPTSKGMTCQGSLTWSYRFAPLWKLSEGAARRSEIAEEEWDKEKHGPEDPGTARSGPTIMPGAMYQLFNRMKPEPLPWQAERQKRRLESIAWLTGVRARETMEATEKPREEFRSGVLQVTITQCIELELQGNQGTYSKAQGSRRSQRGANGGAPALEDVINMGAWESERPPSAYCEIILNGRLVYRTRTKQLTAAPYWNAITERFIRDWTKARLVIVVRDERDREHDPVLGIVAMDLATAFHNGCQITRNYPLVGGQGWGQLRMSLLFKPLDIKLPEGVSGYEVATVELHRLRFNRGKYDMGKLSITAETDVDSRTLDRGEPRRHSRRNSSSSIRKALSRSSSSTRSLHPGEPVDWTLEPRRSALAVQYRHSCFLVIRFEQVAGALKKNEVVGMAALRLADLPDFDRKVRTIPIYDSRNVNEVCDRALDRDEAMAAGKEDPHAGMPTMEIDLTLHAGISRAHRKLTKKDKRLLHVYEAWELAQDVGDKADAMATSARSKQAANILTGNEEASVSDTEDEGAESDLEYSGPKQQPPELDADGRPGLEDERELGGSEAEDDVGFYQKWRDQRRALHRHNKGIMSSKLARTLKFGKDKLEGKIRQSGATVDRKTHQQGSDLTVEMEGQSRLG